MQDKNPSKSFPDNFDYYLILLYSFYFIYILSLVLEKSVLDLFYEILFAHLSSDVVVTHKQKIIARFQIHTRRQIPTTQSAITNKIKIN